MKPKGYGLMSALVGLIFTSMAWGQVDVPEKIKKQVPIYEGAKVIQSMQIQDGAQVILEVPVSPKQVITFYKDTMQQKGWTVVMQMAMQKSSMLNLSKDNLSLVITASPDQKGKTMVQLLLQSN